MRKRWRGGRNRRAVAAVAALGATVALVPASASAAAPTAHRPVARVAAVPLQMPEPPPVGTARAELRELEVAAPRSMDGYSRAKFPHWVQHGEQCDTREVVLERDGTDVVRDSMCRAVSGNWESPYDGRTLTAAAQVDIDHMVPLANAWRSGADQWTTAQRREFANDLVNSQLIAVSAASNRSKADQSPDQWQPPNVTYWCTYSRAWVDVKHHYKLTITEPERSTLTTMLDSCD
ncbi:HNH endonuclease family protein [Streptomyces sp. NPDC018031]|uniref:HNH endonuclease family protein n=1 Tax=Streptomyces sp. NPDC018031 TaxID=3365033 RepID=UPI0037984EDD